MITYSNLMPKGSSVPVFTRSESQATFKYKKIRASFSNFFS